MDKDLENGKSNPPSLKQSKMPNRSSYSSSALFLPADLSNEKQPAFTDPPKNGSGENHGESKAAWPSSGYYEHGYKEPVVHRASTVSEESGNLVGWNGASDPENPMNWSRAKKWYITLMMSCLTFCITFSSSVFSSATEATAKEFDVSPKVTTLGTSFVVLVSHLKFISCG